jgi:hypothetical protein
MIIFLNVNFFSKIVHLQTIKPKNVKNISYILSNFMQVKKKKTFIIFNRVLCVL